MNIYETCPEFENESLLLRQLREEDLDDLLRVDVRSDWERKDRLYGIFPSLRRGWKP